MFPWLQSVKLLSCLLYIHLTTFYEQVILYVINERQGEVCKITTFTYLIRLKSFYETFYEMPESSNQMMKGRPHKLTTCMKNIGLT